MAIFITIGGGKIKRAQGRFGGETPSWRRNHSPEKRSFVAADRLIAATALEDVGGLDLRFPWEHRNRSGREDRRHWRDYNRHGNGGVTGHQPACTSLLADSSVAGNEPSRVRTFAPFVLHNSRETRVYPDGMRIQSARF